MLADLDLIALAGLLVAVLVAIIQLITWISAHKKREIEEALRDQEAPERRDALVVESAERSVAMSERLLSSAMNDNESLRNRVRELERQVASLEAQILELKGNS